MNRSLMLAYICSPFHFITHFLVMKTFHSIDSLYLFILLAQS